jgi:hypothetical protein
MSKLIGDRVDVPVPVLKTRAVVPALQMCDCTCSSHAALFLLSPHMFGLLWLKKETECPRNPRPDLQNCRNSLAEISMPPSTNVHSLMLTP